MPDPGAVSQVASIASAGARSRPAPPSPAPKWRARRSTTVPMQPQTLGRTGHRRPTRDQHATPFQPLNPPSASCRRRPGLPFGLRFLGAAIRASMTQRQDERPAWKRRINRLRQKSKSPRARDVAGTPTGAARPTIPAIFVHKRTTFPPPLSAYTPRAGPPSPFPRAGDLALIGRQGGAFAPVIDDDRDTTKPP